MKAANGLVLIVDDETELTLALAEILQDEGYQTIEAHNGEQALEIYRSKRDEISLVLCDISMPKMDGLEFFRKCLVEFGGIPIVMITAHEDAPRVTESVRLGALDYMIKPFNSETIKKQVPIWKEIGKRRQSKLPEGPSAKMEGLLRIQNSRVINAAS